MKKEKNASNKKDNSGKKKPDQFAKAKITLSLLIVLGAVIAALAFNNYSKLPSYIGKEITENTDFSLFEQLKEENSPLISYINLSPNATFPRENAIDTITVHHAAGDLSLPEIGSIFDKRDRRSSANYAIDSDGNIGMYVEEKNAAWTSSSSANDSRAVTIEVANDEVGGEWHVSDDAVISLVDLMADIALRNGIEEIVYTGDDTGNLTLHKMFKDTTACPGPYLTEHMGDIAEAVNERLKSLRA